MDPTVDTIMVSPTFKTHRPSWQGEGSEIMVCNTRNEPTTDGKQYKTCEYESSYKKSSVHSGSHSGSPKITNFQQEMDIEDNFIETHDDVADECDDLGVDERCAYGLEPEFYDELNQNPPLEIENTIPKMGRIIEESDIKSKSSVYGILSNIKNSEIEQEVDEILGINYSNKENVGFGHSGSKQGYLYDIKSPQATDDNYKFSKGLEKVDSQAEIEYHIHTGLMSSGKNSELKSQNLIKTSTNQDTRNFYKPLNTEMIFSKHLKHRTMASPEGKIVPIYTAHSSKDTLTGLPDSYLNAHIGEPMDLESSHQESEDQMNIEPVVPFTENNANTSQSISHELSYKGLGNELVK